MSVQQNWPTIFFFRQRSCQWDDHLALCNCILLHLRFLKRAVKKISLEKQQNTFSQLSLVFHFETFLIWPFICRCNYTWAIRQTSLAVLKRSCPRGSPRKHQTLRFLKYCSSPQWTETHQARMIQLVIIQTLKKFLIPTQFSS